MNELNQGYREAISFAKNHYENFPVISFLLPKELKNHVAIIYRFARQADDIADEGNNSTEERLHLLNEYENKFIQSLEDKADDPFWLALSNTVKVKKLSRENFIKRLSAFKQDVVKTRYNDFNELLDYCKNSANPVGRLILELHGIWGEKIYTYSDSICTALQLTNFCQDVSIDFRKGRIYLPQNELSRFNVNEMDFELRKNNPNFRALIKYHVIRNKEYFSEGYKLLPHLPLHLRYEILWTIYGGEKILEKIVGIHYNVLNSRPVLTKWNYFNLALKALIKKKNV